MKGERRHRVGDIEVLADERRVFACGVDVGLTTREFDILAALAEHPGWVLSSEQLAELGHAEGFSPSSVNVHVSQIRRKLAEAGAECVIETVRGVGYRMPSPNKSRPATPRTSPADRGFIGREREMAMLESELDAALSREARTVFLTGEPGIGKTACAERLATRAAEGGVLVLWGRCEDSGTPPYWSWRQLLRGITDAAQCSDEVALALERHAQAVDEFTPTARASEGGARVRSPAQPDVARLELFESASSLLREVSRERPLLMVIDDLHVGTEPFHLLLTSLINHMHHERILVLAAYRDGEAQLSSSLRQLLGRTLGQPRSSCISLGGWSAEEVSSYSTTRLGSAPDRDVVEALRKRTNGNPFFVSELLSMIEEAGLAETVTTSDLATLAPSPNIREVLGARIRALSERCRELLTDASVIGVTFPLHVLGQVSKEPGPDLLNLLEEALTRGIIRATQDPGSYRFAHSLMRQVLYADMSPLRRARVHGLVGEALERGFVGRGAEYAAAAHHFSEAASVGYTLKAISCLLLASRDAMELLAFEIAVTQLRRAAALLDGAELSPSERRRLYLEVTDALGDALLAIGALDEAAVAYRDAARAAATGNRVLQARLLAKLVHAEMQRRQLIDALEVVKLADCALAERSADAADPEWWDAWVEIELKRMLLYYYLGMNAEFADRAGEVRALVEQHADPGQRSEYLGHLMLMSFRCAGHIPSEETLELARLQHRAALESGSRARLCVAETVLGFGLMWSGRLEKGKPHLEEAVRLADEVGEFGHKMIALSNLSVLARLKGDLSETRRAAETCVGCGRELGAWDDLAVAGRANLAWLAWREGDLGTAREGADEALAVWDRTPAFPYRWLASWPATAASLAEDDVDSAIGYARDILHPSQQRMPEELAELLEQAFVAAGSGKTRDAAQHLERAVAAGRERSYT